MPRLLLLYNALFYDETLHCVPPFLKPPLNGNFYTQICWGENFKVLKESVKENRKVKK